MTAFRALVLAGSRRGPADPVAEAAGVSHKALAEVGGAPMLRRVAEALTAAGAASIDIAIETPDVLARMFDGWTGPPVRTRAAADGPSASALTAFEALGPPLLVTTADHALLRPEWVRFFVDHVPPEADLAVAAALSDAVMQATPGARRTFLRFSDASLSGCNLFWLATPKAAGALELWRRFETDRKRPLTMARRLGLPTLAAYALGALSLGAALNRFAQLSGARAEVVRMPFGLAAVDVDTPDDLALVRRLAEAQGGPSVEADDGPSRGFDDDPSTDAWRHAR